MPALGRQFDRYDIGGFRTPKPEETEWEVPNEPSSIEGIPTPVPSGGGYVKTSTGGSGVLSPAMIDSLTGRGVRVQGMTPSEITSHKQFSRRMTREKIEHDVRRYGPE